MITYRKTTPDDVRPALDLALQMFIEFHTPDCEQQALNRYFTARFNNECLLKDYKTGKNFMFIALDGEIELSA